MRVGWVGHPQNHRPMPNGPSAPLSSGLVITRLGCKAYWQLGQTHVMHLAMLISVEPFCSILHWFKSTQHWIQLMWSTSSFAKTNNKSNRENVNIYQQTGTHVTYVKTRNWKHRPQEGPCIPAGCNAKFCATWLELITTSTVTTQSIWHKLCECLHFGKFPPQFCESCGATYWPNYETFSAL